MIKPLGRDLCQVQNRDSSQEEHQESRRQEKAHCRSPAQGHLHCTSPTEMKSASVKR
jgi:hypothetical protein